MTTDEQGNLTLETSEPPVLSGALALRLGVGDQTIRNWQKCGMPSVGLNHRGFPLFEIEKCRAWAVANKGLGQGGHGGKREGTGRKKTAPSAAAPPPEGPLVAEAEASAKARESLSAEARARRERVMAGEGTDAELFAIMQMLPEQGGLTGTEANRLKIMLESRKLQLDLKLRDRQLINVEEQRAEWMGLLNRLRANIDAFDARAASLLMAELGLERGKIGLLRVVLKKAAQDLVRGILEEPAEMKVA